MAKYFYLCTGADTPEELREQINADWMDYMGKLAATGKLLDGAPFGPEGKTITANGSVSEFQWGRENGSDSGGYWIMEAANIDEAIAVTAGCPQFKARGNVEVREIFEMMPPQ
jgi:hypothetical protein